MPPILEHISCIHAYSDAFVCAEDIDKALRALLLVQADKSLEELRELGARELKSFQQSFLKIRGLNKVLLETCLNDCAILETDAGKSKESKVAYIFKHLICST